jgi:hypothetical protein
LGFDGEGCVVGGRGWSSGEGGRFPGELVVVWFVRGDVDEVRRWLCFMLNTVVGSIGELKY